ncbi:hypothetical protein ACFXKS_12400 [Streptomyces scopuliridis]|uniref:hypothetical protein n=1 Tax=Streptomyces scopuliridis TaxID=452529 RepID=UPI0036A15698
MDVHPARSYRGRYPLIAAHLPITHKPTPAERNQHEATNERIEIQHSPLSPSSVHRRSVIAMEHDITPLRVAKDKAASLIDRPPWARVDDMPWRDIAAPGRW